MSQHTNLQVFITSSKIEGIISELATKVTQHYRPLINDKNELMVVVTLKGAALFAADLIRKIPLPLKVDFVRCHSYGEGTTSSGNVRLTRDVDFDPSGKHLLILDEIVDTGHTIHFLLDLFKGRNPASLKVCSLLSKPSRRERDVPIDFMGIEVEDKFLVGYGLDHNEKYRNLPDIHIL